MEGEICVSEVWKQVNIGCLFCPVGEYFTHRTVGSIKEGWEKDITNSSKKGMGKLFPVCQMNGIINSF